MKIFSFIKDKGAIIAGTIKRCPVKSSFLILCILLLAGFEVWGHFSPLPAHDWNPIKLKEIKVADSKNFAFAVFGDNRNSKEVFENLLKLVDYDQDIAFAVSLGDMVQKGDKERYRWILQQVRNNLAIPLFTVMGNHELRGKGRNLYEKIFGPSYYSFQIRGNYFIVLDDTDENGLGPVQIRWLEKELSGSLNYRSRLVFMHLPLYDPRGESHHHSMHEKSADNLIRLFLKYRVTHIFASHIHGFYWGRWKGIPFTLTGGAGAELKENDPEHNFFHFLKVHLGNSNVEVEVKHMPSQPYEQMGRFGYMAWLYTSSFFRFHAIQTLLLTIAVGLAIVIYLRESRVLRIRP